jgi:hypothetical protein
MSINASERTFNFTSKIYCLLNELMRLLDKKISIIFLLFIVSSTGCVYLRLLKVKRQLNDFENNFELNHQNGLKFVFKNPVLLSDDIIWLMKNDPLSREQTGNGETWVYVLEKQYLDDNTDKVNYDIPIRFYVRDDKLVEMIFPERFLKNLSKPLLIKLLGSMGKSEISKSARSAGTEFKGSNPDEIPKKRYIISVLGKPYKDEITDHTQTFTYLYNLKKSDMAKEDDQFDLKMTFSFGDDNDSLEKAEYNFNGLSMSLRLVTEEDGSNE